MFSHSLKEVIHEAKHKLDNVSLLISMVNLIELLSKSRRQLVGNNHVGVLYALLVTEPVGYAYNASVTILREPIRNQGCRQEGGTSAFVAVLVMPCVRDEEQLDCISCISQ